MTLSCTPEQIADHVAIFEAREPTQAGAARLAIAARGGIELALQCAGKGLKSGFPGARFACWGHHAGAHLLHHEFPHLGIPADVASLDVIERKAAAPLVFVVAVRAVFLDQRGVDRATGLRGKDGLCCEQGHCRQEAEQGRCGYIFCLNLLHRQ